MNPSVRKFFYTFIVMTIMLLVFIWDIIIPKGIADGMLYVPLVLLSLWFHETVAIFIAGSISSLLILTGYYFSNYSNENNTTSIIIRLSSVILVWIAAFLIFLYKRSEKKAIEYNEMLKMLFENVGDGIITLNSNQDITSANRKSLELFGYNEKQLMGKKIDFILSSQVEIKDGKEVININDFTIFSGKKLKFNAIKKNTMVFPVVVQILSYETEGKKNFVCFILDISARVKQKESIKRAYNELVNYSGELERVNTELEKVNAELENRVAERTIDLSQTVNELEAINKLFRQEILNKLEALAALKESQQMLETIAANFPNGIMCVLDKDMRYLYARGQEIENMGFKPGNLMGETFLPLKNDGESGHIKEMLQKVFDGEKISFEYLDKENNDYYLINGAPLLDSGTGVTQVLLVSQNITTLKQMENEIRRSLEKEQELNEMKSRFVSSASHEFRTPLGAILSSTSLISMYEKPEDTIKRNKHVQKISTYVFHLTEILNNFLSIGKIEEGKVDNQPIEFDIVALMDDVLEEMRMNIKPGQKIRLNNQTEESVVLLDKKLLRNILINLISNAIKYSEENTAIDINIGKNENEIIFDIKDQGIGIPEVDQKHLFETFYRASNVENIKGTGMGLHIVKRYLDIMNGTIEYKSELDKGSCFTIKFENY